MGLVGDVIKAVRALFCQSQAQFFPVTCLRTVRALVILVLEYDLVVFYLFRTNILLYFYNKGKMESLKQEKVMLLELATKEQIYKQLWYEFGGRLL